MKFTLEVNLDQLNPDRTADELSRILRYWGGNVKHYELKAGDREKIFDSGYAKVGRWTISDDEAAEMASAPGATSGSAPGESAAAG